MNILKAKNYGIALGLTAAKYCEVSAKDRAEAGCGCDDANVCECCLFSAAYDSEINARDFSPFEFFASECNKAGDRSDGLWSAYERGVAIGIKRGIKTRLQAATDAARGLQATVDAVCTQNFK